MLEMASEDEDAGDDDDDDVESYKEEINFEMNGKYK